MKESIAAEFKAAFSPDERTAASVASLCSRNVGKLHGRVERRRLQASTRLAAYSDWPELAQVCRLVRTTRRNGAETIEIDYAITSAPCDQADAAQLLSCSVAQLLTCWRGHWGIENRSHYVRDVTFGEAPCQICKGDAPQNLAALRNALVSMLRLEG